RECTLLTRKLVFRGQYLFVNLDAPEGELRVEICDEKGTPIAGFKQANCIALRGNRTKMLVKWGDTENLQAFAGRPIRLKFYGRNAKLYAFWISASLEGKSAGAVAAGGPGFSNTWDS